jgi:hypothetical protein
MNTLPHITTRQQHILKFLYTHRFLNRIQIQAFLHHKDKGLSSKWLKDLREKQYIEWIYNADDFAEKTKPAIYYLSLNGIRFLRELEQYPTAGLPKRYTESKRKQSFIERCLLLADCCLDMERATADMEDDRAYSYVTKAEYADPDNPWNVLAKSEYIHPNLYYLKEQELDDEIVATHNLLEIIDSTLPRYSLSKKLKNYTQFLDSGDWEDEMGQEELPIVMIACSTKAELIYAKRRTKQLLSDMYGEDESDIPEDIHIRFTTVDQIKQQGFTARIWEEM